MMRVMSPLAIAACVAASGCGQGLSQPGTSADRPHVPIGVDPVNDAGKLPPRVRLAAARGLDEAPRLERTPRVSDDPGQIAEVRKLRQQEEEAEFDGALKLDGDFTLDRARKALERKKDRALAEVKRIMRDAAARDERRALAAGILILLGDRSGEDFLFEAVRDGRGPRRLPALQILSNWDLKGKLDLTDPDRARLILACLDDPDSEVVVRVAASPCVAWKIPGTEAKLVRLLRGGKLEAPEFIARDLAEVAESPGAINLALDTLNRHRLAELLPGTVADDGWTLGMMERRTSDPAARVSEPVRTAFLRYLLSYAGKPRYDSRVVRILARLADRTTIPVLEEIIANAREPVSRMAAMEALGRFDPERAVDRILDDARAEKTFYLAALTLRGLASEKNADRIIDAILDVEKRPGRTVSLEEARLLIDRLGPRGRQVVEESLGKMHPLTRMWATWKLKGVNLDAAIDDLRAAGIITMSRDAILETMRRSTATYGDTEPIDRCDSRGFEEALGAAGILTGFDTESGLVPCSYDELIMRFAENSRGGFDVECAVQTYKPESTKDKRDAPYTVRFLYKGRLYRFGPEDRGDWYDVEAVDRAVNFALETAGRKERFLALLNAGQGAAFVFADPAVFRPIAAKYGLPLSNDPDSAVRQGKEFERRAIEKIKKEGLP